MERSSCPMNSTACDAAFKKAREEANIYKRDVNVLLGYVLSLQENNPDARLTLEEAALVNEIELRCRNTP